MEAVLAKIVGYKLHVEIIVNISDYNPYHAILYGDSPRKRELEKFKEKKYFEPRKGLMDNLRGATFKNYVEDDLKDFEDFYKNYASSNRRF